MLRLELHFTVRSEHGHWAWDLPILEQPALEVPLRLSTRLRSARPLIASMPRSARVVIQPDDDAALEEKRPEPPATGTAAARITGLEDPAISEDALAAAEASRRTHDERRLSDASVRGRRSSFFVFEETTSTLDDFLAQPHVMRELRKTERALADVVNGEGSIEDVNMFYAIVIVDLDLTARFVEAGGQ